MGFKDLLNKMMGEDDDEQFDTDQNEEAAEDTSFDRSQGSVGRLPDYDEDYHDDHRAERAKRSRFSSDDPNKVVDIHTTAKLQVVLAKPERFEDARDIADNLNAKRTVVLNLEATNRDIARRLVDFLSGVAYANSGTIKKVANNTYIITPYNVDISGDFIDELENTGVFF